MNRIPFINGTAGLHDSWFENIHDWRFTVGNWPTMPPAFAVTVFATFNGPIPSYPLRSFFGEDRTDGK